MSKQYLYRVSILNKQNNHPLESIAYYCGENQYDIINSKQYSTTTENKVVWNNVLIPDRLDNLQEYLNLPDYLKFRSKKQDLVSNARNILWQSIHVREKRADSQFSRLFQLSIPHFLSSEQSIFLIQDFSKILIKEGMIIDASLHSHNHQANNSIFEKLKIINSPENKIDDNHNQDYTGYLMATLRDYKDGQFINKNRSWNSLEKMKEWRSVWLDMLTQYINNSETSPEEKNNWLKKFSIYKSNSASPTKVKIN